MSTSVPRKKSILDGVLYTIAVPAFVFFVAAIEVEMGTAPGRFMQWVGYFTLFSIVVGVIANWILVFKVPTHRIVTWLVWLPGIALVGHTLALLLFHA